MDDKIDKLRDLDLPMVLKYLDMCLDLLMDETPLNDDEFMNARANLLKFLKPLVKELLDEKE